MFNSLFIREFYVSKRTSKKHSERRTVLPLIKDRKYINLKYTVGEKNSTIRYEKNKNLLTTFKNPSTGGELTSKLLKRETSASSTNNNSLNVPLNSGKNTTKHKNNFQNNSSSFSDVNSDFNYITAFENTQTLDNLTPSPTVVTESATYFLKTESTVIYKDSMRNIHSLENNPLIPDDFVRLEFKISYNVLEGICFYCFHLLQK